MIVSCKNELVYEKYLPYSEHSLTDKIKAGNRAGNLFYQNNIEINRTLYSVIAYSKIFIKDIRSASVRNFSVNKDSLSFQNKNSSGDEIANVNF